MWLYFNDSNKNVCMEGSETQQAWSDGENQELGWQQGGGGGRQGKGGERGGLKEWRDEGEIWNQLGDWAGAACIVVGVSQV